MATNAVGMTVGKLVISCITHLDHFQFEVEVFARQRMVAIDVYIKLADFQHYGIPWAMLGIHGDFHTGLEFVFDFLVAMQMFNRDTLGGTFLTQTITLLGSDVDGYFVADLL